MSKSLAKAMPGRHTCPTAHELGESTVILAASSCPDPAHGRKGPLRCADLGGSVLQIPVRLQDGCRERQREAFALDGSDKCNRFAALRGKLAGEPLEAALGDVEHAGQLSNRRLPAGALNPAPGAPRRRRVGAQPRQEERIEPLRSLAWGCGLAQLREQAPRGAAPDQLEIHEAVAEVAEDRSRCARREGDADDGSTDPEAAPGSSARLNSRSTSPSGSTRRCVGNARSPTWKYRRTVPRSAGWGGHAEPVDTASDMPIDTSASLRRSRQRVFPR